MGTDLAEVGRGWDHVISRGLTLQRLSLKLSELKDRHKVDIFLGKRSEISERLYLLQSAFLAEWE